jgi:hypothetical protein
MRHCVLLMFSLLFATGCATIASGPTETITVTSEPSDADARLVCGTETTAQVTPARFVIARKTTDCTLTIEKTGFERETAILEQGMNRWTWLNIPIAALGVGAIGVSGFSADPDESIRIGTAFLLTGLGGLVVDRLTWRLRDHDPKTVRVKLRPSPSPAAR